MILQLLVLLISLLTIGGCHDAPIVKTEDGLIKGQFLKSKKLKTFSAFRGIPYAKPPIGPLRFQPPVLPLPWTTVLNATQSGNPCPQRDFFRNNIFIGNEDCLYINVYTPQVQNIQNAHLLPVMLFIHGGAEKFWSGNYEDFGPELLMDKNIVLATFNYRLGALGFFTTADDVVPGNNGLKDQNFAIKWVKKNIKTFGGDPNRITLFGESAGGINVHLHMVSPLSRDLIQNGIAQSGTSSSHLGAAPADFVKKSTIKLAELLNCTLSTSLELVECLREISVLDIVNQEEKFIVWNNMPFTAFSAVIEQNRPGAFLIENPIDTYKAGLAANIPFMTGINSEEGAFYSADIFKNKQLYEELNDDFDKLAPLSSYLELTHDITQRMREFYFNNKKIDNSPQSRAAATKMLTDSWRVVTGADNAVFLHTEYTHKPAYFYVFGYRASTSFSDILSGTNYNYGVSHCDDLIHLFKLGVLSNYIPNESDANITELLLTLWTNFAKTGDPNIPERHELLGEWKPYNKNKKSKIYYILSASNVSMVDEPFPDRLQFWKDLPIKVKGYINNL